MSKSHMCEFHILFTSKFISFIELFFDVVFWSYMFLLFTKVSNSLLTKKPVAGISNEPLAAPAPFTISRSLFFFSVYSIFLKGWFGEK